MRKDIKTAWLAALRSGQYRQTRGTLCRTVLGEYRDEPVPPGMCCLGVLCDIAPTELVSIDWEQRLMINRDHAEDLGIESYYNTLADMNDGNTGSAMRPFTFAEIADWIEVNIPTEPTP